MKKITLIFIMVFTGIFLSARESETLIRGHIESSGFGGPVVKFSRINDEFAILVGDGEAGSSTTLSQSGSADTDW